MAFTVETGSGLAGANAYLSVADFKTHHTDRGRSYSAYADGVIQGAIVKATDYIDKQFSRRFRGWKQSSSQGLAWPRTGAFDNNGWALEGVPAQLTKATAEYALLALSLGTELAPPEEYGDVLEATEKVGPIETSYKYAELGKETPSYPEADMWIDELIQSTLDREVGRG